MAGPRTQEAAYLRTILEELQAIRKLLEGQGAPASTTVAETAAVKRAPRKRKAAQE